MNTPRRAFYAISGDPVTYGHLWVMGRAVETFDELTVALAVNPDKKYTFTFDERADMIRTAYGTASGRLSTVEIKPDELTVRAAKRAEAQFLVRGVRSTQDFESEMDMAWFNATLERGITTWLLPTPAHLAQTRSSFVKKMVGLEDWETILAAHVPPIVLDYLRTWHAKKKGLAS